jgi:hypothetical protein
MLNVILHKKDTIHKKDDLKEKYVFLFLTKFQFIDWQDKSFSMRNNKI